MVRRRFPSSSATRFVLYHPNFPPFNTLLLFAPFVCNRAFSWPSLPGQKFCDGRENFVERFPATTRGQLFSLVFSKLLILNDRSRIFLQYHLGGLSRCTLIVCFGSVRSSQRPYVFHPSATT